MSTPPGLGLWLLPCLVVLRWWYNQLLTSNLAHAFPLSLKGAGAAFFGRTIPTSKLGEWGRGPFRARGSLPLPEERVGLLSFPFDAWLPQNRSHRGKGRRLSGSARVHRPLRMGVTE